MYETFSEDPHLVAMMGAEIIKGIQGFTHANLTAAACMKHFIAYSATSTGQDQAPVLLDPRDVENYYLTPYRAAVKAGIRTAMESYQEISGMAFLLSRCSLPPSLPPPLGKPIVFSQSSTKHTVVAYFLCFLLISPSLPPSLLPSHPIGVPMVSSKEYLKDLLRYELDFHGMLVTDYGEVDSLHEEHAIVATNREAVKIAMLDTSIDMSMTAWDVDFARDLIDLVEKGEVPIARLDESVERIVQLKEELGLLDHPYELVGQASPLDVKVGSMEDKRVALQAIRESITLLKNEHNVLPLDPNRKYNILVVGPTANSLTCQSGGWTMHWHGPLSEDEFSYGTTLFAAVEDMVAAGSTVDYLPGVALDGKVVTDKELLADRARRADIIIAGLGEGAYAEASANIPDLVLPFGQEEMVLRLAQASTAPIVTVLFEGRPRLLGSIPALSTAVLHAFLPGPDGGLGVGEVLFGSVTPSGRIPFTYPKHQNGPTLTYYHKLRQRDYDVEWEFGAGLSYTSFAYKDARITSGPTTDEYSPVEFSVKVRNTGKSAGKHTVMLFGSDVVRRVTPEVKMLKAFNKTKELQPGETQTVTFTLDPMEDLSYYGVERHRVLEEGDWLFGLGEKVDCRKDASTCLKLTVKMSPGYSPICQAVCTAWGRVHSACAPVLLPSTPAATNTTTTTKEEMAVVPNLGGSDHASCMATCAQQGYWRWEMADCLRDVVMEPRTLCQQLRNICAYPF